MKSQSFIVGNTESCFFEQQKSNTDTLFDVLLHLQAPMT
jgi:hypothetical protein